MPLHLYTIIEMRERSNAIYKSYGKHAFGMPKRPKNIEAFQLQAWR
jgi:hypothetical protein